MPANFVVIGVGSNLQSPIGQLRQSLAHVKKIPGFEVLQVSNIYESTAQLPPGAPETWNQKFLNAAILVRSESAESAEPQFLLQELKHIERVMGRDSAESWAPRIIDLDILYWSGVRTQTAKLQIPHPSLTQRPFALLPLLEVYPGAEVDRPNWATAESDERPFDTKISNSFCWPKIMGIVNLTQDSFSDGAANRNLSQIESLAEQVDILDFGAESTRPGAVAVDADTEWKFLKSALEIAHGKSVQISIDSCKPKVVANCLEHFKIDYINDVTGLRNPEMQALVKASGTQTIVMHALSVPPKANETLTCDLPATKQLSQWWQKKKTELINYGISADKLIFDPGIGFGKTKEQCLSILKNLEQFSEITEDILIGHSRKSFLTLFTNRPAADRDLETALVTGQLNQAYCQYLRIHDPVSQKIALRMKL